MRTNPEQHMGTVGWADTPPASPPSADGVGCAVAAMPEEAKGLPSVGDWFVLHLRSRQEKVVHKTLTAGGLGCFLPLMKVVKLYGKRKAKVEEPMFPGYLFLRGSRDEAFAADRTGRVVNIISVCDQERLDWELTNLHMAIAGAAPLEPFAYLTQGMRVEVRCGPFRGMQGVIERRGLPGRLHLQVGMLGRSMSMEVDASLLDPVD